MAQDDYIRTALRVPPDLHRSLHDAADAAGRSFNAEIIGRLMATFGDAPDPSGYRAENEALREALEFTRGLLSGASDGQSKLADALIRYLTTPGTEKPDSQPLLELAQALKAAIDALKPTPERRRLSPEALQYALFGPEPTPIERAAAVEQETFEEARERTRQRLSGGLSSKLNLRVAEHHLTHGEMAEGKIYASGRDLGVRNDEGSQVEPEPVFSRKPAAKKR